MPVTYLLSANGAASLPAWDNAPRVLIGLQRALQAYLRIAPSSARASQKSFPKNSARGSDFGSIWGAHRETALTRNATHGGAPRVQFPASRRKTLFGEHSEPRCRVTALRRGTRLSRGGNVPLTRTPNTTRADAYAPQMLAACWRLRFFWFLNR
jgi:hypothetical protein